MTNKWKAGCLETGTPGLEGGLRKRSDEETRLDPILLGGFNRASLTTSF